MARRTPKRKTLKRRKKITACPFCKRKEEPDYKDSKTLEEYLTDRAKIVGRDRSGLCSKHQRRLSVAIKRARHLGLLPFAPSL